jgi:cytochrome c oxidase cbb3-type subunit 1
MFFDLMTAGLVQGYLWQNLAPWEQSLIASMPFWHVRTIAGVAIITGQLLQAFNMWMTARSPALQVGAATAAQPSLV